MEDPLEPFVRDEAAWDGRWSQVPGCQASGHLVEQRRDCCAMVLQ